MGAVGLVRLAQSVLTFLAVAVGHAVFAAVVGEVEAGLVAAGASAGHSSWAGLSFSPQGLPFVAFADPLPFHQMIHQGALRSHEGRLPYELFLYGLPHTWLF